jgi:hypothetical protein
MSTRDLHIDCGAYVFYDLFILLRFYLYWWMLRLDIIAIHQSTLK